MAEPSPSPADVEALNDRLAREHPSDDYYERSPWPIRFVERRRLAIIRAFVGNPRGLEIAEVGSGGGQVLRMFPIARLTAIDVSSVYLENARRNLAGYNVRFLKGELEDIDLPAASYDRVICTEVLEHVLDPDAVLAAIARVLRPNGIAVVTVPNDPLILRVKGLYPPDATPPPPEGAGSTGAGTSTTCTASTTEEFRDVLSRHLEVVEQRGGSRRPPPASRVLQVRAEEDDKRRGVSASSTAPTTIAVPSARYLSSRLWLAAVGVGSALYAVLLSVESIQDHERFRSGVDTAVSEPAPLAPGAGRKPVLDGHHASVPRRALRAVARAAHTALLARPRHPGDARRPVGRAGARGSRPLRSPRGPAARRHRSPRFSCGCSAPGSRP